MNNQQSEQISWGIAERLSSATGIAFALLLIYGFILEVSSGFPPTGDSAAEVSHYFAANQATFKAYLWSSFATIPFQIWFFATLFVYMHRASRDSVWPVVGLISIVVGNATTFLTNVLWGVLTLRAKTITDPSLLTALWTIYHLSGFTLGLVSSTILLGFGIEMARTKSMWRAIGFLGIVAGIYEAVVWVVLCFSEGRPSPLGGLSYVLFILWVLLTSVRLTFVNTQKV